MQDDLLKLENQLCFPFYVCSKEIIRKYKPFLDKIDLTYTQYIVMMVLWERKSITVKELGECLYLDSGTLTPLLKRLEQKELIRRERSGLDERQVEVMITKRGGRLKDRAANIPLEVGKCINFSAEELQQLYQLLHKLLNQL
jgi:DNA-binding MarR family transcriptional regulator